MSGQKTPVSQGADLPQNDSLVSALSACGSGDADSLNGKAPTAGKRSKLEATPKAGAMISKIFGFTPKAGSTLINSTTIEDAENRFDTTLTANKRMFDATPKAGAANRHGTTLPGKHATRLTSDSDGNCETHSIPSRDIDNTFSFREKNEKRGEIRNHQKRSQSSSGMWDVFSAINLSLSKSVSMKDAEGDVSPEPCLAEADENDLFAMDVGLAL
jgi:hypothetical protein